MKNMKPKRYAWLIATLTIVVVIVASASASAQPVVVAHAANEPWPMWRHDSAHTGVGEGTAPSILAVRWKVDLNGPVESSPSVAYGKVYVGSRDHNLYCLDAQGRSLVWKFTTGWRIRSSPAIVDGRVYTGADDGNVYCLDANTGALIWKTNISKLIMTALQPIAQIRSSPTVMDGRLYVGHLDHNIYCLEAETGAIIWKYQTRDRVVSSPAVVDERVFIGSCDRFIYALRESDGKFLWRYDNTLDNPHPSPSRTEVDASPCMVNNTVYIFGNAGYWYALDAVTGTVKWKYYITVYREATSILQSMPIGSLAYANDKIYFVDRNSATCADAYTGDIIWKSSVYFISYSSPTYADGKAYFCSDSYAVYCLNAETGEKLSSYVTDSFVHSSPAVAYGHVYVGSGDWNLYCFQEAPPNPPKTSITSVLSTAEVPVNTPIAIKGAISPSPSTSPQVIATFTRPDGTTTEVTVIAESDGTYEVLCSPDVAGTWTVKASWRGNDLYEGSSTPEVTFTVKAVPPPPPPSTEGMPHLYYCVVIAILVIAAISIVAYRWRTKLHPLS